MWENNYPHRLYRHISIKERIKDKEESIKGIECILDSEIINKKTTQYFKKELSKEITLLELYRVRYASMSWLQKILDNFF